LGGHDDRLDRSEKVKCATVTMQICDTSDSGCCYSIRPRNLCAQASRSIGSRGGLLERRVLRFRSGFSTSCLQSEMILPHMPVQPDSYSLRHMIMHLRKSQLASNA
jgi:hypothetical protein